jgi:uncharacterized protein YwgA
MVVSEQKEQTIANVALSAAAKGRPLSKTHLQKIVYLLQSFGILSTKYRFVMHHYGPYASEITSITENLADLGLVRIDRAENGFGFQSTAGEYSSEVNVDAEKDATAMIEELGGKDAWELELMATIHFVDAILRARNEEPPATDTLIDEVRELKPRFAESTVRKYLAEVRQLEKRIQEAH